MRERATSVVLTPEALEWADVAGAGRGGAERTGRLALPSPAAAPETTAGAVPAVPPAEAAPAAATVVAAEPVPAAPAFPVLTGLDTREIPGPVTAGVETGRSLLRVVRLPPASASERAAMVELQVDKFSPFPIETLAVSHEVLRSDAEGQDVLIGAVRREVADGLRTALGQAGLKTERLDAVILGWWRLLCDARGGKPPPPAEVALILSGPAVEVLVLVNGVPAALRAASVSPSAPEAELAAELEAEVEQSQIALEIERGLTEGVAVTVWHPGRGKPAEVLSRLRASFPAAGVSACSLDDLPPVAVGLARRAAGADEGRLIDLSPPAWGQAASSRTFRRNLVLAFGILAGAWVLTVAGIETAAALRGAGLQDLKAEAGRWKKEADDVRDIRDRAAAIRRYTNQTHSALECLREVSALKPRRGVDFSLFSYRKDEGSVSLKCAADTVELVYEFKSRLDRSPLFVSAELQGPRLDANTRRQLFDLTLGIPGAPKRKEGRGP